LRGVPRTACLSGTANADRSRPASESVGVTISTLLRPNSTCYLLVVGFFDPNPRPSRSALASISASLPIKGVGRFSGRRAGVEGPVRGRDGGRGDPGILDAGEPVPGTPAVLALEEALVGGADVQGVWVLGVDRQAPGAAPLERGLNLAVFYHGHGIVPGRVQSCQGGTSDPLNRSCSPPSGSMGHRSTVLKASVRSRAPRRPDACPCHGGRRGAHSRELLSGR
jgi:hypothetical protein